MELFGKAVVDIIMLCAACGAAASIVSEDSDYAMFMLHSSEMMPGGSPSFPDGKSIEALYQCIEKLFCYAKQCGYVGCKLSDYKE